MKNIFVIICSIIIPIFSKPNLCVNCKFFKNSFIGNEYGKCALFTPFYISNADFNDIKKIKKYKINSRNFTYDGLTFSSSVFSLWEEEVKDEI